MISVTDRQRPEAEIPDPSYRGRSRNLIITARKAMSYVLSRNRGAHSFIAVNITAPNNQQHIPGINHHGR